MAASSIVAHDNQYISCVCIRAEKLQIPANTIARWERGDMAMQHPELLRLAVEHLSCCGRQNRRS